MSDPQSPEPPQGQPPGDGPWPPAGAPAGPPAEPSPPPYPDPPPPAADTQRLESPPTYAAEPPPRGRQRLLILLASALAAFVACAGLALAALVLATPALRNQIPFFAPRAGGAPPEAPQKFVDQPQGPVSIADDFSRASDRWDRSQTAIEGGAYVMRLELANFDSYGLYLGGSDVRDFDMAVDATQTAGPADGEFGIRFRQSAPDDHLMFSISPSGYYRLLKVEDKTYTSLVPWTRHEGINIGPGVANRLRVVAEGPSIAGYINGEQVLTFTDDEQQAGQLTLGLVTFDSGGLAVSFDNLEGFALVGQPTGETLSLDLAEEFSDPAGAPWSVGGATISDGAYEFFVGGSVVSWQQPLPSGSSEVSGDFVLEVDATMLSGQEDNSAYGVMFGDGGDFGFFALMIVPDGRLLMYRNGDDGYVVIPALELPAVNPGLDATNRIRVEVRGRAFTITINDQQLPAIDLPDGVSMDGMAGLIVQGADVEGARARFDNFRLEEVE